MQAMILNQPNSIDTKPLHLIELPTPEPNINEIRIRIHTCAVCHTDLHIVEGELRLPKLPLIPGHQIVGIVDSVGNQVKQFKPGDRVGIPWLHSTCDNCDYCKRGLENLCDTAKFTGFHVHGGYAEYIVISEDYAYAIPEQYSDAEAAPLLCGGVIGYRALRLSEIKPGGRLGIFGFGSSAHITIQVAKHWNCDVYVFTRSKQNQELAISLGATWVGSAQDMPSTKLDSAIIFAPAGELVPITLKTLRKGGKVVLAGIHMTPIPEIEYTLLYHERTITTVANSTRNDVHDFLKLTSEIPVKTKTTIFPLAQANTALFSLKHSQLTGTGVLQIV
ncbi:MAG: zinc-dependent alcohol dehydrogenase family protein [bacterium]